MVTRMKAKSPAYGARWFVGRCNAPHLQGDILPTRLKAAEGRQITLCISPAAYAAVDDLAHAQHTSPTDLAMQVLDQWLRAKGYANGLRLDVLQAKI
jgi:hypothetical protein